MIYYNAKNNGFYDSEINKIPANSVEITQEYHAELLKKQSAGLVIQSDKNGYPIAVERVLTDDEIKLRNKSKQQQLLNEANAEIDILNRAIRLRRASDLDKKRLELLENYTIDLYELDLNNINVNFPEMP